MLSGVYGDIVKEVGRYHLHLMSGVHIVLMVKVMKVMPSTQDHQTKQTIIFTFVNKLVIFVMRTKDVRQVQSIALRS